MFTNKRGSTKRHIKKIVRVGTYQKMLKVVADVLQPKYIIEHGMGDVSTSLFHDMPSVERITSFENDPNWQTCKACQRSQDDKIHKISSFIHDEEKLIDYLSENEPDKTLVLVDGPHVERCSLIPILQSLKIAAIIEHDAEALNETELADRLASSQTHGYEVYQYVDEDPETILYTLLKNLDDSRWFIH